MESLEKRKIVIALGGNSMIKEGEPPTVENQFKNTGISCKHLAQLIKNYKLIITHGNGPQFGFILRRIEIATGELHFVPFQSINADTQGAMGYMIQEELHNQLVDLGLEKKVRGIIPIVMPVVVDENDPAFKNPTKFIGSFYTEEDAKKKMKELGWEMKKDANRGWRRVVPSPKPVKIIGIEAVKDLVDLDYIVIAAGGGGIPVKILPEDRKRENYLESGKKGYQRGAAAVIDKDFASALLATGIGADLFVISTAVEKVALNYGTPQQKDLDRATLEEIKKYDAEGHFPAGSMGPKIKAAIQFLESGGKKVIITSPEKISAALEGKAGTHIVR